MKLNPKKFENTLSLSKYTFFIEKTSTVKFIFDDRESKTFCNSKHVQMDPVITTNPGY